MQTRHWCVNFREVSVKKFKYLWFYGWRWNRPHSSRSYFNNRVQRILRISPDIYLYNQLVSYPNLSPIFGIRNTCAVSCIVLKESDPLIRHSSASFRSKYTSSSFLNSGCPTDTMYITILLSYLISTRSILLRPHFHLIPYSYVRTHALDVQIQKLELFSAPCCVLQTAFKTQSDSDSCAPKRLQSSQLGESLYVKHSIIQSRDVGFSASEVQGKKDLQS